MNIAVSKNYISKLVGKVQLTQTTFDYTIENSELASQIKPGQFLHILCGGNAFLRRPISICDVSGDRVRFIFDVKGKGTDILSRKNIGDDIDLIGPLGNGFTVSAEYKNPVVIGGGIGTFPLLQLVKKLGTSTSILGFRNKSLVLLEDEFKSFSDTKIATDDGSYGFCGYVSDLLKEHLKTNECDIIYACGPTPMLSGLKKIASEYKIPMQISLEQRMGCGIGACLVCSCETIFEGTNKYKRVCKDGPVFWANEVNI